MTIDPAWLLGPFALTVGALIAVGVLWRDHQRAVERDRAHLDRLIAVVERLAPAVEKSAAALEAANRDQAQRHRRDDS